MTMAKPSETPEPVNIAPATVAAEVVSVVMIGNSYGARSGDVVKVSPEQAASLIANGHAREPYDK